MNAIYEGGQLRLLRALSLPEHTLVQVRVDTVEPDAERAEWLAQSERSPSTACDNDADDVYNELLAPSCAGGGRLPTMQIADSGTHTREELTDMLDSTHLQETPRREMSEMSKMVLEAGRVATAKMLDYYKRMGIRVTPQMTLAPEPKKRVRTVKA